MKKIFYSFFLLLFITTMILNTGVIADEGEFMISNLKGKDITINLKELKELPIVEETAISADEGDDKNVYEVKGVLLSDLLSSKGVSKNDLKAIRLIAGDGYQIDISENILKQRKLILTFEINGEPLYEKSKPIRVIIPNEMSMYWLKNLKEIRIVEMVETVNIRSLYFLETVVSELEKVDYTYYESKDKAIKISELIEYMDLNTDLRSVRFIAADGFEKNESLKVFAEAYIKITGKNAPLFFSPDFPKGMHIKDMLFINYGSTSICSVEQAKNVFDLRKAEDIEGIPMSELLKESKLLQADRYEVKAVDGYSVEISAKDMESGIVYTDEKDTVRIVFPDLEKQYSVKYLYEIKPLD